MIHYRPDVYRSVQRIMVPKYERLAGRLSKVNPKEFTTTSGYELPAPKSFGVINPNPNAADIAAAVQEKAAQRAELLKREAALVQQWERAELRAFDLDQDINGARSSMEGTVRHPVALDPFVISNPAASEASSLQSSLSLLQAQIAVQDQLTAQQLAKTMLPAAIAGSVKALREQGAGRARQALALASNVNPGVPKALSDLRSYLRPDARTDPILQGLTQKQWVEKLEGKYKAVATAMANEANLVSQYAKDLASITNLPDAQKLAKLIEEARMRMATLADDAKRASLPPPNAMNTVDEYYAAQRGTTVRAEAAATDKLRQYLGQWRSTMDQTKRTSDELARIVEAEREDFEFLLSRKPAQGRDCFVGGDHLRQGRDRHRHGSGAGAHLALAG
ncbi:MAG: hypothetical protein ACOVN9_10055, partial [Inhella sp.]